MVTFLSIVDKFTGVNPVVIKQFSYSGLSEQKDQSYYVNSKRSFLEIEERLSLLLLKCIRSLVQFQWSSSFLDLSAIKDQSYSIYGETTKKTKQM